MAQTSASSPSAAVDFSKQPVATSNAPFVPVTIANEPEDTPPATVNTDRHPTTSASSALPPTLSAQSIRQGSPNARAEASSKQQGPDTNAAVEPLHHDGRQQGAGGPSLAKSRFPLPPALHYVNHSQVKCLHPSPQHIKRASFWLIVNHLG